MLEIPDLGSNIKHIFSLNNSSNGLNRELLEVFSSQSNATTQGTKRKHHTMLEYVHLPKREN